MARAKRGFKARRRRNRVLKQVKGYSFDRRTKFHQAATTLARALHYSYISRRLLKRDMRSLWIVRIGAAARDLGTSYSKMIFDLKNKGVTINRKMLAEIAATDMNGFKAIFNSLTK